MKKLVCGKHLLLAFMCVLCSSMSALAFNVGDYVYTKVGKYRITGSENLVANGEFTDGSTEGWMATDEFIYPLAAVFAPAEEGGVQVLPGLTALDAGMYQAVRIDAGGTYVVTFKVKGATAGFTDHDMTGAATNYINAYYNTDGALASVDNTTLLFGENGVNGGYQFDFGAEDFTEICFAVNAPIEGNIMIDFRGLAEGLIIKDVECHAAEEVYDDRIAVNRIAYFNKYLAGGDFDGKEHYAELQECIDAVNDGIADNASPEDMAIHMENLESYWTLFVEANFSNVLNLIPTTDGSANTGNNSANWMNWTGKYNKLNSLYNGKAPWTWSTDRWAHKTAAANSPLQIQWQRKASGYVWNNIATLTATLTPGTYYWGVSGQGGMMTLNKNRWVRSWANENAATQLFFNGDTTEVFILNAARTEDYVYRFELTKEKEITLGIICNTSTVVTDGFDVAFYNPVLYKVLGEGLSPEEEAYIDIVNDQLEAFKARIEVANEYLSDANTTLTWGKEALREGTNLAQERYDEWAAMDTATILDWYRDELSLGDIIVDNGVDFLNGNYINPFIETNKPLTDMLGAIAFAWETLGKRIYASSSKKDEYEALIVASDNLYKEMLLSEYSEENAAALIAQKVSLEAMAEEFKAAVNATTIVDIDFGTQDNPVQIEESQDWETGMYSYYITGAKGTMTFTDILGSYAYTLGYGYDYDEVTGKVFATDSLGMLRVGNSEAVVNLEGLAVAENSIVNIQFDLYAGRLTRGKIGYKVLSAEGDTICGLFYSPYDGNDDLNTFGVNYNRNISAVGSSSASNLAIAAASNKTHFDIVLDYGTKTMYCTTSGSLGTVTTEIFDLPESVPAKFVIYSNYNNADRRCWFDNLKILNISTEEAPARILGDVNSDEQHTMSDVVMQVNAVLGIAQENYNADVADMNNDGNITMADVVLVLRLVLGYDSVAAARSAVRTAAVPVLSAGDMIAVDANRMVLPINLNNDEAYSAFQLDVVLPEGVKLAEATLTNRAKSSHAIAWNALADGTTRVVAYAMNNATFKGSEGALFNLVLETSADLAADGMIALKGGLFTAVNGTEDSSADLNVMMRSEATGIRSIYGVVQVSGTEGAVIVESNDICVVNVYALTGQMVRTVTVHEGKNVIDLPKGVYIVNNQRVIVK